MKLLVPVKRVIDYNVRVHVSPDGSGVALAGTKMSMNPFDEIAVEEAVRLKEKHIAQEVVAVSIGPSKAEETLRTALAIGADRAILIETETSVEPFHVAKILTLIAQEEQPDMVLMGKQAIDDDACQTGQLLAGFLQWPQATFASEITIDQSTRRVRVIREVDGGLEAKEISFPCVITADLRLNQPRFASLPNIMKARSKPLTKQPLEALSLTRTPHTTTLRVEPPAGRKKGVQLQTTQELVDALTARGVL